MAYIDQQTKKEITPAIKAVLTKYNFNGSVAIKDAKTTLSVKVKGDKTKEMIKEYHDQYNRRHLAQYGVIGRKSVPNQISVRATDFTTPTFATFIKELDAAMTTADWNDNTDFQRDYFDITYYKEIIIIAS